MPSSVVKSFAKRTGKSVADVEAKWKKAQASGKKCDDQYACATAILKNMLHLESTLIVDGVLADLYEMSHGGDIEEFLEDTIVALGEEMVREQTSTDLGPTPEYPVGPVPEKYQAQQKAAKRKLPKLVRIG